MAEPSRSAATSDDVKKADEERVSVTLLAECRLSEMSEPKVFPGTVFPPRLLVADPEQIFFIDSMNSILVRGQGGSIALIDSCFEGPLPLAVGYIGSSSFVTFDRQNGTLIMADNEVICFRREYGGTLLLKNPLQRRESEGYVMIEMPLDEAVKIAQMGVDDDALLARRPLLRELARELKRPVSKASPTPQETVIIDVPPNLLTELCPLDSSGDNPSEVPSEWSSPSWPVLSALAERIRLLLHPEHPYNFEYAPEWKGIDKEVMVSEAARRLTFERWPHMDYRWALPCQMAEAGFYHQPNKGGDDRVLCFACLVCLVCWEPSDEPWSEHERHSPNCRFIRNNANPNVPLALTLGSLGPFRHEMHTESHGNVYSHSPVIIFSTCSETTWVAAACEQCPLIHFWRTDRVVQINQAFKVDVSDSFIAMKTGYTSTETPRRPPRVTWSDDTVDLTSNASSADSDRTTKKGTGTDDDQQPRGPNASASSASANSENSSRPKNSPSQEVLVTALCTVGRTCLIEQSAVGAVAGTESARYNTTATLIAGVAFDDSKISRGDRVAESSSEVNALNSVNNCVFAGPSPRIVADLQEPAAAAETPRTAAYRPFIVVYQISENGSRTPPARGGSTSRSGGTSEEKLQWTFSNSSKWHDLAANKLTSVNNDMEEVDFAEAMMLMEGEGEVPDWVTGEHQIFGGEPVDGAVADDGEVWNGTNKGSTKFDDKLSVEFVPINYDPPPANVVLVQCFRLPAELDEPSLKITSIVPTQNGLSLVVVLNREGATPEHIASAILVYRLNFSEYITSVQEQAIRCYVDKDNRVEQLLMMSSDVFAASRTRSGVASPAEPMETAVIRTSSGDVFVIDLNTSERLKLCEEKALCVTLAEGGRCFVLTKDSRLVLFQVESSCTRQAVEDEDEDATVAALLANASVFRSSTTSVHTVEGKEEAPKAVTPGKVRESDAEPDEEQFSAPQVPHSPPTSQQSCLAVLAMQQLSRENLKRMWKLTRSDSELGLTPAGCALTTPYSSSSAANVLSVFYVTPPAGWNEIQLHQKFRKNPQHCLRTDRSTRSWILQSDSRDIGVVQAFELHFQQNVNISHVNVRFSLHSPYASSSDVEIKVLRRRAATQSGAMRDSFGRPSALAGKRPSTLKVDMDELTNQCDVVAGPYRLSDYLEIGGTSAIIQLPGKAFQVLPSGTHGAAKGMFSAQGFYIVLSSVFSKLDLSVVEQPMVAQKARDKEKTDFTVKTKGSSKRREASLSEAGTSKTVTDKGKKPMISKSTDIPPPALSKGGADLPPQVFTGSARRTTYSSPSSTTPATTAVPVVRLGIECIEEISMSVMKAQRTLETNERIERRMMIETSELHVDLLFLAAGLSAEDDAEKDCRNGEVLLQKQQALDIIAWLIDNWNLPSTASLLTEFSKVLSMYVEQILVNGFMRAPRSIAHKWCSTLIHLMRLLNDREPRAYAVLVSVVLIGLSSVVDRLYQVKNAGSLHWLLTLAFAALKMGVTISSKQVAEGINLLLSKCAHALTKIGAAWKRNWRDSVHEKLALDYGLCGLPLDLVMYEWPSQMLSLFPRTCNVPATWHGSGTAVASSGGKSLWTPTAVSLGHIGTLSSKAISSSQTSTSTDRSKVSVNGSQKEVLAVSAFINSITAQDEMDWMEMFNVTVGDDNEALNGSAVELAIFHTLGPPPGSSSITPHLNSNGPEVNGRNEAKRKVFLSAAHLSGLLEVEPLSFSCIAGSEHVKVENIETGAVTAVSSSTAQLGHVASGGPVQLKSSNGGLPADCSSPSVLQQNLRIRMKQIALEQAHVIKDPNIPNTTEQALTSIGTNCAEQTAIGSTTQGSSASTFGVPTTPKTTPFMTPTPLSPSHLSPISSDAMLDALVEEITTEEGSHTSKTELPEPQCTEEPTSRKMVFIEEEDEFPADYFKPVTVVPSDLLKPPPLQVIVIDRMAAGARKFVILDFGDPILLTDILIPSCAELSSVFVDAWLLGEGVDGQRIASSSHIGQKSIVLQDMSSTMLVRFVKLTYVGRQMFNAPCRIPVGLFFGHRFYSKWQSYACPIVSPANAFCMFGSNGEPQRIGLAHLRQLSEDLRCRHQLASAELRQLVREDALEADVKEVYKDCMQLRLQWNIVQGVVSRLQYDKCSRLEGELMVSSWEDCSSDQLRVLAEQLFSTLSQASQIRDVSEIASCSVYLSRSSSKDLPEGEGNDNGERCRVEGKEEAEKSVASPSRHPLLDLDTAVTHFSLFCTVPVPKIQVDCATWLFHHGIRSAWWPDFFPHALQRFFSSPNKRGDQKIFLLLSFLCNHSVKSSSSQPSIIFELLDFIDKILKPIVGDDDCDDGALSSGRLDATLLSWSLMLLSSAFDVALGAKRKADRWAFLAGEYAQSATSSPSVDKASDWVSRLAKKGTFGSLPVPVVASLPLLSKKSNESSESMISIPASGSSQSLHGSMKSRLESLWEQHLTVLESMKESVKMSESLNAKLQKKVEQKKQSLEAAEAASSSPPASSSASTSNLENAGAAPVSILTFDGTEQNAAEPDGSVPAAGPSKSPVNRSVTFKIPDSETADAATNLSLTDAKMIDELVKIKQMLVKGMSCGSGVGTPKRPYPCPYFVPKNAGRSNRQRQYNVRLKLPLEVCRSVARCLVRLLCAYGDQLPTVAKVYACKVIARICANASHHTIPLVCALDGRIDRLLKMGVSVQNSAVVGQAVLCLFLDVIEAESRALAKSGLVPRSGTPVEGGPDNELYRFYSQVEDVGLERIISYLARKEDEETVTDNNFTCATAKASALLPTLSCWSKSSDSFSFANYDEVPDGEERLRTIVDQLLDLLVPSECLLCSFSHASRLEHFRRQFYNCVKRRLARGEPLSHIFRWMDEFSFGEAKIAPIIDSLPTYVKELSALAEQPTKKVDMSSVCASAMLACFRQVNILCNDEKLPTEDEKGAVIGDGSGGSSSPSLPGSPPNREDDPSFDQLDMNMVSESVDSENATKALDNFADTISGSITKDAEAFFDSCDCVEGGKHALLAASASPIASSSLPSPIVQDSANSKSIEEAKPELGKSASVKDGEIDCNSQNIYEHFMKSFVVEMRSVAEGVMMQPSALAVDERLECHLGLRAHMDSMSADLLADTLLRRSVHYLMPWLRLSQSRTREPENEVMRLKMGLTLGLAIESLSALISSLNEECSGEYVLRLLNFHSDFLAGVAACTKRCPDEVTSTFDVQCVEPLLSFAVKSNDMTEQLWTCILRTLRVGVRKNAQIASAVISSPLMPQFLKRMLFMSVCCFNESMTVGPAMVNSLEGFLSSLYDMKTANRLAFGKMVLSCLRNFFDGQFVEFVPAPVEILAKLIGVVHWFLHDSSEGVRKRCYVSQAVSATELPEELLASFAAVAIRYARSFFLSQSFLRPAACTFTERCTRTDDICFQSMKKPNEETKAPAEANPAAKVKEPFVNPYLDSIYPSDDSKPFNVDVGKPAHAALEIDHASGATVTRDAVPTFKRQENFVSALLKEVYYYVSRAPSFTVVLLNSHPETIEDLFKLLSVCSAADRDLDSLVIGDWVVTSSADRALRTLIEISNNAGDCCDILVELTVKALQRCTRSSMQGASIPLSKPVAYAVTQILDEKSRKLRFASLSGHLIVARDLERCVNASVGDWMAPVFAPLVRQMASLSSQVLYGESLANPKRPTDVKIEGLFNYAPICAISSSSELAHQLCTLLATAPSHRRARMANWTFHFYGSTEWLDLTLSLPYQIVLHEVHVRPHAPALNTAPSAVQVELCSDPSLSTWTLLGPPVSTLGFSKIRIPTLSYPYPVNAVRLHLKRPPEAQNLGLSQILLLGTSSARTLTAPSSIDFDFVNWLLIMDKLCAIKEYSVWEYAPELPKALVAMFLGRSLRVDVYSRVTSLLVNIDDSRARNVSVVQLIIRYIVEGRHVTNEALEWVAEFLRSRCLLNMVLGKENEPEAIRICITRQRQLLVGISDILASQSNVIAVAKDVFAVLFWSTACILWDNLFHEVLRCDTTVVFMDIRNHSVRQLCELAASEDGKWPEILATSSAWLLCSIVRAAPNFLLEALRVLNIVDAHFKPLTGPVKRSSMRVVSRMCQSSSAVQQLLSMSLFPHWVDVAIDICEENIDLILTSEMVVIEYTNMEQLISIVQCIASLCCIDIVVKFLDSPRGAKLFRPLISFAVHTVRGASHVTTKRPLEFENATIELLRSCVSAGLGHRERISGILCSFLECFAFITGSIQQMILRCVLDDETITVKMIDEVTHSRLLSSDVTNRILHPLFGCGRRERAVVASLYTPCRDLLPASAVPSPQGRKPSAKRLKVPSKTDSTSSWLLSDTSEPAVKAAEPAAPDTKKEEDEASKRRPVTYLICDAYSPRRPMTGSWNLGHLIDVLRSAGRLNNRSADQRCYVDCITSTESTEAANVTSNTRDRVDGYFTLELKVNSSTPEDLLRLAEDEGFVFDGSLPPLNVPRISTLQYFARAGGLAFLTQHLQLYQPSPASASAALNQPVRRLTKDFVPLASSSFSPHLSFGPVSMEIGPQGPMYFAPSESYYGMEDASAASLPSFAGFGMPLASSFADDVAGGYEQDFEFIDMPLQNAVNIVQKGLGGAYAPGNPPGGFASFGAAYLKVPRSVSQPSYSLSTALSPHVIISFSVFLRLEGYAELLVTFDRQRSKRLIRLAMGVSTREHGTHLRSSRASQKASEMSVPSVSPMFSSANSSFSLSLTNIAAAPPAIEMIADNDALALLPFVVLEKLYIMNSPATALGRSIRDASIFSGALDILLVCLAHYSHQQQRVTPMRPPEFLPVPEAVVLTEHLLRASAHLEQMRAEAACSANGGACEERFSNYSIANSSGQSQQNFWAKGTGFGSGTTQQQWNVDLHVMKRRHDEHTVTHLLQVLTSYIFPGGVHWRRGRGSRCSTVASDASDCSFPSACADDVTPVETRSSASKGSKSSTSTAASLLDSSVCEDLTLSMPVVNMLSRSCLLPTIFSYLRNDSVLDISGHVDVYEAVVQLVAALALCPAALNFQGQDSLTVLLSECDSGVSLLTMLKKLYDCISVYLSKLTTESFSTRDAAATKEPPTSEGEGRSKCSEEGLLRLAPIITRTCTILSRRIGEDPTKTSNVTKSAVTMDEKYTDVLKAWQFDSIPFFAQGAPVPYHFSSSLANAGCTSEIGRRTRRLAQEIVTLMNSLPLTASSSVFLRASEERLDVMKVLITGPADTPYMNGCFEFDVWFPGDYPNSPMHVNLETTGNHTVRFNPNLYNDGKVCLSILNTWHGRPEERWNPETSSFLQVIVSMQSLILVSEPYFNEPGYERSKCTQAGQQASRDYDANIRQATVRWAMLEMIRHPPVAFAEVIKRHFWLKRHEIVAQVSEWIKETEIQIEEQHGNERSLQTHLASLKRHFASLQEEFSRMTSPEEIEETPSEKPSVEETSIEKSSTEETSTSETPSTSEAGSTTVVSAPAAPNRISLKVLKL